MFASRGALAWIGVALAAAGLALSPALDAARASGEKRVKPRVSLNARGGIGSFTPAAADPRLAAFLARTELSSTGFRFTPPADPAKSRQVTVAVRARSTGAAQGALAARLESPAAPTLSITPSAYNLGASIGWKRFALSGDVARIDTGLAPGARERVTAGASYTAPKWSSRVQASTDAPIGNEPRLLAPERSYSLDVGGSVAVARNLDVTAGVQYRLRERDRLQPLADDRRDAQAVYLGTAFRF